MVAELSTFSAVLLLRPYDELSFESRAASLRPACTEELRHGRRATIYVDPRYGRWNPETLSVVPLSS